MTARDVHAQFFQSAACALVVTDRRGIIVAVNSAFEALVGVERRALVSQVTFASLLNPGSRLYFETYAAHHLHLRGWAKAVELTLRGAEGPVPVLVEARADDSAEHSGLLHFAIVEAAARKAFEQQLQAARSLAEQSEARARALAQTLQATLLPPAIPDVPGLQIAAAYRPAGSGEEVGGDFYDVFAIGPDEWVVTIGDVSGKGVDAAAVTALARFTIRASAMRDPSPAHALHALSVGLLASESSRFCTVILVRLSRDGSGWLGRMAIGGHSPPLLVRAGSRAEEIGVTGSLLGLLPDPQLNDSMFRLDPADLLVMFTDGVSEARSDGQFFGDERAAEVVTRQAPDAAAAVNGLLDEVLAFQRQNPRDDIAIVALTCLPASNEGDR